MPSPPKITRAQWETKLATAKTFMQKRSGQYNTVLIEVAAQHPLKNGTMPDEEFSARLLQAKQLYQLHTNAGKKVEVYIPGSRHKEGSHIDAITLSQAGVDFLVAQGLPATSLHGEDLNQKYKGEAGVYNSADECFVAASYFKDGMFGQLLSVVSPVQLMRKALIYIWQGTLPLFYTAPTQNTYHNWVQEIYNTLPEVRDNDPDWQGKDSKFGQMSREMRKLS
jgi:hypothetical protein